MPSIFYAGVNDRKTNLFESLWTLPIGVSYNSYIIKDKHNALIDTADQAFSGEFLDNINTILEGQKPEDLIINHLEPDHSGSVLAVKNRYPDIKIIGNSKTVAMLNSFYGHISDTMIIEDGQELSLGSHTLKFYITPMVHWPETMMTYETSTQTLFSGDAFGCFGALNGGVCDDQTDSARYFSEMIRYYSAIVGKYGIQVQKAITKFACVEIKAVCPTHGPVWKREIEKVINLYSQLSQYDARKGVTIVYGSMYGHTAATAEKLAYAINELGVKNIEVFDLARTDKSFALASAFTYNTLLAGSPCYNAEIFPPVREFLHMIKERGLKNRFFGTFGDYSWAPAAFKKFDEFCDNMAWTKIEPSLYQKSGEPSEVSDEKIMAMASAVAANCK